MPLNVTIIMPCLNEAVSLPHCIANAQDALARIAARYAIAGEIVIADNGSTDGSQVIATALGARVVPVARRGYGAAIIGGAEAALGGLLLIGDADGSYDFTDGVAMIGKLLDGVDLCMGSRFLGGIAPGAMPWKNRHIGNPLLTGLLNLFFRSGIDDAHCGLRAITRDAFLSLGLRGEGMEFASEMVVKASLRRMRIAQTAATLSVDLRDRAPHLRPWRDGWRHLRYLVMLSPTWAFGAPALLALIAGSAILAVATGHHVGLLAGKGPFGASWMIVAGFLLTTGHFAALMAVAAHVAGVREGYRLLRPSIARLRHLLTLETMLGAGLMLIVSALAMLCAIAWNWRADDFAAPASVLPLVIASSLGAIGLQTVFGGLVMAIVGGHSATFIPAADRVR
ncbi:glycosyltransferase [Sphingomonas psychrotolerans]|uniref:Glycosyltransferase n=1 Tax=Sphingomonas psychrotolerans TaxID=1327635 RepID=A0ABU3MYB7_9SPHN|nr:glycosyltransferase [Sphingomonas psychrotolerans]MDT8757305.1 glycosyltransferase [Sphingomonas psychrotolerans]